MSGALAILAAPSVGTANTNWALMLVDTSPAETGYRTVSVTFEPGGTASAVGGVGPVPPWHLPPLAGIGAGWSVRLANVSAGQTTYSGAALNTWHSLGINVSFGFSNDAPTSEGYGGAEVQFSPDGGTTVITASFISWSVGYIA